MPNDQSALVNALNELAALGTERDREQLAALQGRWMRHGFGSWWQARPSAARAR